MFLVSYEQSAKYSLIKKKIRRIETAEMHQLVFKRLIKIFTLGLLNIIGNKLS